MSKKFNFILATVFSMLFALITSSSALANTIIEAEPNNSAATATPFSIADTLQGVAENSGVDNWTTVCGGLIKMTVQSSSSDLNIEVSLTNGTVVPLTYYLPNGNSAERVYFFKMCAFNTICPQITSNSNATYQLVLDKVDYPMDVECLNDSYLPTAALPTVTGNIVFFGELSTAADEDNIPVSGLVANGTMALEICIFPTNYSQTQPFLLKWWFDTDSIATSQPITGTGDSVSLILPISFTNSAGKGMLNISSAVPGGSMLSPYKVIVKYIVFPPCMVLDSTNFQATPPVCGQQNGTVKIYPSTGVAPYEYSKNSGGTFQSSNTFTGLGQGQHQFAVRDATNCTVSYTLSLNSCLGPDLQIGTVQNAVPGTIACVPVIALFSGKKIAGITGDVEILNGLGGIFSHFESGTLNITNAVINPNTNAFSAIFNPYGDIVSAGDTLFWICVLTPPNPQSDTIEVGLNGADLPLSLVEVTANGQLQDFVPSISNGFIIMASKVTFRVRCVDQYGIPVSLMSVIVAYGNQLVVDSTDANGFVTMTLNYVAGQSAIIGATKLKEFPVSIANVVYIQRWIVGDPISGMSDYDVYAADIDRSFTLTLIDGIKIMQLAVGLIQMPCSPQVRAIAPSWVFPTSPTTAFFNAQEEEVIQQPSLAVVNNVEMVIIPKGDARGAINASGFVAEPNDRGIIKATYSVVDKTSDEVEAFIMLPEQAKFSTGIFSLGFDSLAFDFMRIEILQGQSLAMVENKQISGQLNVGFFTKNAKNLTFNAGLPVFKAIFKRKMPNTDLILELLPLPNGEVSQVYDSNVQGADLILERSLVDPVINPEEIIKIWPNPTTEAVYIKNPFLETATATFVNALGQWVATYPIDANSTIEVPVNVDAGTYSVVIRTESGTVLHREQIEVVKN
jgi:hypothetical protein